MLSIERCVQLFNGGVSKPHLLWCTIGYGMLEAHLTVCNVGIRRCDTPNFPSMSQLMIRVSFIHGAFLVSQFCRAVTFSSEFEQKHCVLPNPTINLTH